MRHAWWLLAGTSVWIACCGALFSLTQHADIFSGLYWAVTTATTVGYGDVTVHGASGQVLAIGTELTAIPLLAAVFALVTSGRIRRHVDARLAEHHHAFHERIDRLERHSGAGRGPARAGRGRGRTRMASILWAGLAVLTLCMVVHAAEEIRAAARKERTS
jgi:voltage-gated potassium channel